MKVLLVKPAFARLLQNSTYLTYPIGLMYVAAALRHNGHEVVIWHDDVSNQSAGSIPDAPADFKPMKIPAPSNAVLKPLADFMDDFGPDVVGVGYNTIDWQGAHAVAEMAAERGIRTVAGGIHPSLLPDDELKPKGPFDAVVVGEGDDFSVMDAFEWDVFEDSPGARMPTTFWPAPDGSQSLFDTITPARDAVYGWERYPSYLQGIVQTQRGCPYNCGYCAAPSVFGRKVRTRDPKKVAAEVRSLPTSSGRIIDDSFFVNKKHSAELCEELSHIDYQWVCDMALQDATETALDAMKNGGCTCVNVGIESAVPRWRELSGKRVKEGEPERLLEMASAKGIGVVYYFMIGFPGETGDEIAETLYYAEDLKRRGAKPCISLVTPYPGTRLWDLAVEHGSWHDDGDWSGFIHQNSETLLADCSPEDWTLAVEWANEVNG